MEDIIVTYLEKPVLKEPILVEGLPGVGNVGKLAAEHLVQQLNAKKFAVIFSKYFPPQVLVQDNGVIKLVCNELYYVKAKTKEQHDLILLVGDYQGLTPEGQYELSDRIINIAQEFGVKKIFTLGGYGVGRIVEKPCVLGAATDRELVEEMKKHNVVFAKGEPGSGIVGASGLLLGLGLIRDLRSVCLMGETSGYYADPKSAKAVLEVITKILNLKINYDALDEKAEQLEKVKAQVREVEMALTQPAKDDLQYIG
ncbi:MAG: proteasome assembly chaperone family protein [Candidatus Thermoplasmatota archaeon]